MENIEEQIKNVIHKLRPYLQRDGGDIEYVDFKDGRSSRCFRSTKYFISIIVQISCIYREFVILCFSRWIHYKFLFTSHTYFR